MALAMALVLFLIRIRVRNRKWPIYIEYSLKSNEITSKISSHITHSYGHKDQRIS